MWGSLETDLGVRQGKDEWVQNGALGGGRARQEKEGWPEVGGNLGAGRAA